MKAVFLNKVSGPDALEFGELAQPQPAAGHVLVKVYAAALTPTELQWGPTWKQRTGQPRPFPLILSHEFSGTVQALGPGVSDFKAGQEVYGMNDWFENGAQAEYCVAPATALAPKPASLDHARAAVVPISALTAWQGLFEHARLQAGERVLVHGAAGAVGVFAVQLARWRGAHIIATASAPNLQFVRQLGTEEVIDYKANPFESAVRDIDVVFDTVGGATLERSWGVLKPGGRVVTIATQSQASADPRAREAFFIMGPNRAQLTEIGQLIDADALRPVVDTVFSLPRAKAAYAHARQGPRRGKIVLQVVEEWVEKARKGTRLESAHRPA